ncbi:Unknown protein sequence [Pseudomonas tremae]|uniref:Uncharacterized protein n=1 Tax=Pseudomonas tremae TaxID=200454 RepID=A0AA40TTC7_9PSED|nr:Unknown protein sequence [Pseudomonas tremae]RMO02901.1 hypothetical protein ALQ48_04062 [Pseudomonas coronafaciens pv. zizaniae]
MERNIDSSTRQDLGLLKHQGSAPSLQKGCVPMVARAGEPKMLIRLHERLPFWWGGGHRWLIQPLE